MQQEINLNMAIDLARNYFSKLYREEEYTKATGLTIPNLIGFNTISATEENGLYVIKCEVKDSYFSPNKYVYTLKINKMGELK
ncbi:MAG: hypothetical protein WBN94_04735, partial [Methanothrix sp.]